MRWDALFDDLESQLERERTADEADLEREEERLRLARLGLRDRLSLVLGHRVILLLAGGSTLTLSPAVVGRDWLSGEGVAPTVGSYLVPLGAVVAVRAPTVVARAAVAIPDRSATSGLAERLGFGFALRDLARRRLRVRVDVGRSTIDGTIDRVARDHVDVAVHDADEPRRASVATETVLVPLAAVESVRIG